MAEPRCIWSTRIRTLHQFKLAVGVDGKWVGLLHGQSHITLPIEPGTHHVCVRWRLLYGFGHIVRVAQTTVKVEIGERMFLFVSAEAPSMAYLGTPYIELHQVNAAEGSARVEATPESKLQNSP